MGTFLGMKFCDANNCEFLFKIVFVTVSGGEESEDGGGGWHKYVAKRNKVPRSNLSKSTKLQSYSTDESDEEAAKEASKLRKHKSPYKIQKMKVINAFLIYFVQMKFS